MSLTALTFPQDKFKQSIMWLKDTGILDKIRYDVLKPGIQTPQPRVRHNKPLILQQLGIIMIIVIVGLFISIIVFLMELFKTSHSVDVYRAGEGIELTQVHNININYF